MSSTFKPVPTDTKETNSEIMTMFVNEFRRRYIGNLVDLVHLKKIQKEKPNYEEQRQVAPNQIQKVGIDEMIESQKLNVKSSRSKLVAIEELFKDDKAMSEAMSEDYIKPANITVAKSKIVKP